MTAPTIVRVRRPDGSLEMRVLSGTAPTPEDPSIARLRREFAQERAAWRPPRVVLDNHRKGRRPAAARSLWLVTGRRSPDDRAQLLPGYVRGTCKRIALDNAQAQFPGFTAFSVAPVAPKKLAPLVVLLLACSISLTACHAAPTEPVKCVKSAVVNAQGDTLAIVYQSPFAGLKIACVR